jgi:hypothetical protein
LGAGEQLGRRGLGKPQHHGGGLDLDAFARIELDLHRRLGFGQHTTGVELAGIFEQGIHGGGFSHQLAPGPAGSAAKTRDGAFGPCDLLRQRGGVIESGMIAAI